MSWSPFVIMATGLDTLPVMGRVMLLALLLSCALYGFLRVLPEDAGSTLNVLYRKGALLSLLLVPAGIYLFEVRVPVPVEQVVVWTTPWPGYITYALLCVWIAGAVFHLYRLLEDSRATSRTLLDFEAATDKITERAEHWRRRLNLKRDFMIVSGGAEQAWHVGALAFDRGRRQQAVIVLPAAALNWPVGLIDALLLVQMAQLQHRCWAWLVFGRFVQAIYWPTPMVATLVAQLSEQFEIPAQRLAAAAYRDPEGWRRDARNLQKRSSTLVSVPAPLVGSLLRTPNTGDVWTPPLPLPPVVDAEDPGFESKWADTKREKRNKERDPYEQAYWLIAAASIAVGVASTLTVVQAPPEFEPQYLEIKWRDQMLPRMREYQVDEVPEAAPPIEKKQGDT